MALESSREKALEWQERSRQKLRENPPSRVPLPKVSKRQAKRNKEYSAARAMKLEQQPFCERCLRDGAQTVATQTHHIQGRDGERMMDVENLLAVCVYCHEWLHAHPQEAKELGYSRSRHRTY